MPIFSKHEVVIGETQDIAIAHGKFQHHRRRQPQLTAASALPHLMAEILIPSLHPGQHLRTGAHIARRLSAEGRQFKCRDLPASVAVVGQAPAGEDSA